MTTRHGDSGPPFHQRPHELGVLHHRNALLLRGPNLDVVAGDGRGPDHHLCVTDIFFGMADLDRNLEPVHQGSPNEVGPGDRVSPGNQAAGQSAHADSPDPDQVYLHIRARSSEMRRAASGRANFPSARPILWRGAPPETSFAMRSGRRSISPSSTTRTAAPNARAFAR